MEHEVRYLREPAGFADGIRTLAKVAKNVDGFAAFDEQTLLNLESADAAEYLLIVETADYAETGAIVEAGDIVGSEKADLKVVGAAIHDVRNGSVELAIEPSHRRRGLGRRLLREAREHFAGASLWAHGTLPPAQALAESEGLAPTRTLLVMSRPLVGIVSKPDLADVSSRWTIAPIDPEADLEAFTKLNAVAFADHPEQGQLTAADMKQRFAQDWFDPDLLLLVRPRQFEQSDVIANGASRSASVATASGLSGDDPLAFVWLKPQSDFVELYVLGVHPKIQGQGLGGALSNLMLTIMRDHGFQQAILYVELDNEPAVRSYRRVGFDVSETHTQYRL